MRLAREGLLVLSRFDRAARREYVAAFNTTGTAQQVVVPTATPSATWSALLGTTTSVTSAVDGRLTVTVPPIGALLLRAGTELPRRSVGKLRVTVAPDDFSTLQRIEVTGVGADPASVSVAQRRTGGRWRRLGVDPSAPYRVFVDPRGYRKGETVELVAVARSSSGAVSVSPVVQAVVRR